MTSNFVVVQGIRYHYLQAGEGPPVLLLHGFPENCLSFEHNVDSLVEAGLQVFVPDLKGYGQSDKPAPGSKSGNYRLSCVSLEIADLIGALGFERMAIVGHDWGGAILSAMMVTAPERIERAVLMNAPFRRFLPHKTLHFYRFNVPGLAERQFTRDGHAFMRRILSYWSSRPEAFTDGQTDAYVRALSRDGSFACALAYYRALPKDLAFYAKAFRMKRPRTGKFPPTLVLFGAEDPILPPKVARWAHSDIGGSRLVLIQGAGHFVHREAPYDVNARLVEFLSSPQP